MDKAWDVFLMFIFGVVAGSLGMAQIYKEESMTLIAEIDTLQDTVIDCASGHWDDKG